MEPKTEALMVRMTPAEMIKLDRIAQLTDRSRGGVLRALLSAVDSTVLDDLQPQDTNERQAAK